MEAKSSNSLYQLQPKFLVTNFNFDAMASTVTQSGTSFKNTGVFRTKTDLVGMSWFAEDTLSHLDFKYPLKKDFSGVTLSYHYAITGHTPLLDAESAAPTITVRTEDGEYYIRLWNYVVDRPEDSWEKNAGEYLHKDVRFPEGRTPGNATGEEGNIVIDFDSLYAGWTPYIWQNPGGIGQWVENPDWVKVPVEKIKEIMWSFVPLEYNNGSGYLEDSMPYEVTFTDWTVSGSCILGTEAAGQAVTRVRLCDDYDDIYNMTPERVVSEYERLGYRNIVNCYIGASHYYDKCYSGDKMNVKTGYPFNPAFEAWYGDYLRRLHALGVKVIHSVSMECVDPPESWKQRNWEGVAGTTNWEPKPSLLSFVNYDVKMFYISYVKGLARLSAEAGMQPVIQLGESWWWYIEDGVNNSPCFYDSATRYEYHYKYGKDMHVFKTGKDSIAGHEDVLYFLRDKNGEFTHLLRNELKAAYPDALFTVLFFPPSVMDKTRVPEMMGIVNLPAEYWIYPNLDFFMLEDYDYLIDSHMWKHRDAINFVQNNLAYPPSLIHYFAGFVLNSSKLGVWKNINQAIVDGFNQQFGEVYVWAYAQVKRDGWHPPVLVSATPKPGNYAAPQNVVLTGPAGSRISYTIEGDKSGAVVNLAADGGIYIDKSTILHVFASKDGRQNEYELSYTMPMKQVSYTEHKVDGDPSEWANDSILVCGQGRIHDLAAVCSNASLYVMVTGSELDKAGELNLFIDTTGTVTSGFRNMGWKDAGIDYMVSNGTLKKYIGTGSDSVWEEVGTLAFARTSICAEWAVPLRLINRTLPLPLYLGFGRDYKEYAPMLSNKMAEVSCEALVVTLKAMQALGWKRAVEFEYTYDPSVNKTWVKKPDSRELNQEDIYDLNECLEHYNMTDPNVICHFLAQCMAECEKGNSFAEPVDDNGHMEACLEDFVAAMPNPNQKYVYKYRGAGAIHLTGEGHYEKFAAGHKEWKGENDPHIMCESDDLEAIKENGCNYVAFKYPWEAATFYFGWKTSPKIQDMNLIEFCKASKEQDNQDYRLDCEKYPSDEGFNGEQYNNSEIYRSVIKLGSVITGRSEDGIGTLADGGSFATRQYYYRLCRDLLYPIKTGDQEGDI